MPGRVDIRDRLREPRDHGVVDLAARVPRENAGADLDDDSFA